VGIFDREGGGGGGGINSLLSRPDVIGVDLTGDGWLTTDPLVVFVIEGADEPTDDPMVVLMMGGADEPTDNPMVLLMMGGADGTTTDPLVLLTVGGADGLCLTKRLTSGTLVTILGVASLDTDPEGIVHGGLSGSTIFRHSQAVAASISWSGLKGLVGVLNVSWWE